MSARDAQAVDAVDMLVEQHRRMEKMLASVLEEKAADRAACFTKAADELMSHVMIEEELFYPAVRMDRTEDILLESLEEHLSLKRVLEDLVDLEPGDTRFDPKLHVLEEQVRHHHKEEEKDLFPKVKKCMTKEKLEALGAKMAARQQELLQRGFARMRVRSQTDDSAELPRSRQPVSSARL